MCLFFNVFFVCLLSFLGPHPRLMEGPRLGGSSELQLLAYTTATATPEPHLRPTPQLMATPDP